MGCGFLRPPLAVCIFAEHAPEILVCREVHAEVSFIVFGLSIYDGTVDVAKGMVMCASCVCNVI